MENVVFFEHVVFEPFPYIWPLAGPNIAEKGAASSEKAKLSSRDQVGFYRSLPDCLGRARTTASAGGRRLRGSPQAIGEAALAADLITA